VNIRKLVAKAKIDKAKELLLEALPDARADVYDAFREVEALDSVCWMCAVTGNSACPKHPSEDEGPKTTREP
jgi:hypothetical protein